MPYMEIGLPCVHFQEQLKISNFSQDIKHSQLLATHEVVYKAVQSLCLTVALS